MCHELQYPVPDPWGIIILLFNILGAGSGTCIAAYCKHGEGFCCSQFMLGVLQIILSPILVGWCWGIWHGWKIYEISKHHGGADMHVTAHYDPHAGGHH